MKNVLFRGLCTALVTPFIGGQINYPMLEVLIRRQIKAGVKAIVLAGTTGESPTLSDEEKLELFHQGVKIADGKCRIIAGTGSNDTGHAIALTQAAEDLGADGALVVTPYYNKTTPSGCIKHYQQIASAVSLPIIAYNVPSRTGVDIDCTVCRELAKIPNLAGIKEAGGNLSKILQIIAENGSQLPVWSGNDDQTVPIMSIGGQGVISVASNVAPLYMSAMVTAAADGDYELAGLLQRKLQPMCRLLFCQVNPIPVKAAMKAIGYDVGSCRMPLDALSPEQLKKVNEYFGQFREVLDGV